MGRCSWAALMAQPLLVLAEGGITIPMVRTAAMSGPALECLDFWCLSAPQITWYHLVPQTSPPSRLSFQMWRAAGAVQPCPTKPTSYFPARGCSRGCSSAHLPSRDRSIPSNCFRSHLRRKGWTEGAQPHGQPNPDGVLHPSSPLNLQRSLGFLGVHHQPVEARYPQVDILLTESWRRKARAVRLG